MKMRPLPLPHRYDVYRWDAVGDAFTYADRYKKATFTAASDTFVYARRRELPERRHDVLPGRARGLGMKRAGGYDDWAREGPGRPRQVARL